MSAKKIADLICDLARSEDTELRRSGKGIMKCPELAFVYLVAKEWKKQSCQIFNADMKWFLEHTDNEKGFNRTDLYIEQQPLNIAIEFKMGYALTEWEQDIEKLLKININNILRIFCLIKTYDLDPNKKIPKDEQISKFEDELKKVNLKKLASDFFCTLLDGQERKCVVSLWEVVSS